MWSSRKIDKLAYENVVYKYLAGNEIERGIAIDEEEDKLYGDKRGDELPPELNTQQKIREKLKEIEQGGGDEGK